MKSTKKIISELLIERKNYARVFGINESRIVYNPLLKHHIRNIKGKANHYIDMFQPVIDACKTSEDYGKAYTRISSCIAGIILGRGVNQSLEDYLAANPVKKVFFDWWHSVRHDLNAKSKHFLK